MLGVYELDSGFPVIVSPYYEHSDVQTFFQKNRFAVNSRRIKIKQVLNWCSDLTTGLTFLASKPVIHRDIAARNCMLDDNLSLKIADFGLARAAAETEEPIYFIKNGHREFALKWLALESFNSHNFTTKSDVWSTGITIWEFFVRCKFTPYENQIPLMLLYEKLISGERLKRPLQMPEQVYSLLILCWEGNPLKRISAESLSSHFVKIQMVPSEFGVDIEKDLTEIKDFDNGFGNWNSPESFEDKVKEVQKLVETEREEGRRKRNYVKKYWMICAIFLVFLFGTSLGLIFMKNRRDCVSFRQSWMVRNWLCPKIYYQNDTARYCDNYCEVGGEDFNFVVKDPEHKLNKCETKEQFVYLDIEHSGGEGKEGVSPQILNECDVLKKTPKIYIYVKNPRFCQLICMYSRNCEAYAWKNLKRCKHKSKIISKIKNRKSSTDFQCKFLLNRDQLKISDDEEKEEEADKLATCSGWKVYKDSASENNKAKPITGKKSVYNRETGVNVPIFRHDVSFSRKTKFQSHFITENMHFCGKICEIANLRNKVGKGTKCNAWHWSDTGVCRLFHGKIENRAAKKTGKHKNQAKVINLFENLNSTFFVKSSVLEKIDGVKCSCAGTPN